MKKNKVYFIFFVIFALCIVTGCDYYRYFADKFNIIKKEAESNPIIVENDIEDEEVDEESQEPPIIVDIISDTDNTDTDENDDIEIPEDNEPVREASGEARQYNSKRRVVCLGDSLTEGTGGEGVTYPGTLESLSGAEVLNYGVYADKLSAISARAGSNPQYTVENVVIPADPAPVKVSVKGKYGYEMLLNFGDAGVNNVYLNGIEGKYIMDDEGDRQFLRITPGEEAVIPAGTQLITQAAVGKKPDDIIVIWGGTNDNPQTLEEIHTVIDKINEIIEYEGTDEYIVLTIPSPVSDSPVVSDLNDTIRKTYGNRCLDIRDYLVNHAMDDFEIEKTKEDKAAIARGDVPSSIMTDEIHGDSRYYEAVGQQVYKKLVELGYLK